MPCLLCHKIKSYPVDEQPEDFVMQEATRVVTWETAGSPMVPVCDSHAFALAKEKLVGLDNIYITEIDDAMDMEHIFDEKR